MAELTRPVSAREREARARDLLGGLEGATDFAYAARDGELPGEDGDEALGELLPGEPPTSRSNDATSSDPTSSDPSARGGASPASKSPLRKALAFARGGEAPATASDAALCASFRSDRVGATYGMDAPEGSVDGGAGDAAADTAEAQAKKNSTAARRAAGRCPRSRPCTRRTRSCPREGSRPPQASPSSRRCTCHPGSGAAPPCWHTRRNHGRRQRCPPCSRGRTFRAPFRCWQTCAR